MIKGLKIITILNIGKKLKSPVPAILIQSKKLVLKSILREKHQTNEINLEKILEKIQKKVRDVMNPLSKLWTITETAKDMR